MINTKGKLIPPPPILIESLFIHSPICGPTMLQKVDVGWMRPRIDVTAALVFVALEQSVG